MKTLKAGDVVITTRTLRHGDGTVIVQSGTLGIVQRREACRGNAKSEDKKEMEFNSAYFYGVVMANGETLTFGSVEATLNGIPLPPALEPLNGNEWTEKVELLGKVATLESKRRRSVLVARDLYRICRGLLATVREMSHEIVNLRTARDWQAADIERLEAALQTANVLNRKQSDMPKEKLDAPQPAKKEDPDDVLAAYEELFIEAGFTSGPMISRMKALIAAKDRAESNYNKLLAARAGHGTPPAGEPSDKLTPTVDFSHSHLGETA